ncbi:MAG TPA: restriction endonuclease subunit S [Gemmatimonadales bacterium]|nr:restriction endonuclease subunit S [Gemmatimonadales bacterium]
MAGDWREATVIEIASSTRNALVGGPFGSNLVSRDYVDHGVPVIRGQNMGARWVAGEFAFVSPEKAESLEANLARPGDIVFTQRGTLGQVSLVPDKPFERYLVSQSQMKVTVDRAIADPLFFYYVFRSAEQQEYIRQNAIQTGVPHTNLGILRDTRVPLPPLPEQQAISNILGTLDDKIELNRRMSETLEAIARAIFKSWFVDFDPVRTEAEGRDPGLPKEVADLFPDRLEGSEMGKIPAGWTVGGFGDVVEVLRDQENPLDSPNALFSHYSIPAFDEGQVPKPEDGHSIKSLKFRVPAGVVLVSKLNPEIERVWMVDVRPDERPVCSTEFLVMRGRPPFTRGYVFCLARSPVFRQQIEGLVTGTSKSHQRAQAESVLNLRVVVPPAGFARAFEHFAELLLARTLDCRRESATLASLRDALLPKLVSGEVRVKDVKRLAGSAGVA